MKIVLIGSRCYPVSAPRANRTTELAKEFAKRGHEVVLYALLGDFDYTQISKETNIRFMNLGKTRWGLRSNTGSSANAFTRVLTFFLKRIVLFPECLMFPMVKKAIANEGNIDLLLTVANPHIVHMAASMSNLGKVKSWIADCGDPFMGNPVKKFPFYFKYIEKRWCKKCDYITIPIKEAQTAYYEEFHSKIRVIPQGFDFTNPSLKEYKKREIPTFGYSGIFYKGIRDPSNFLNYLLSVKEPFKFVCFTKPGFLEKYKDDLGDRLEIHNYIPRNELLMELSQMDFLINISNDSGVQRPSKLIDYALTKRPILNISSVFSKREQTAFEEFFVGDYKQRYVINDIERYNIVNVADQFLSLVH